jgi:HEPN domain-containing protein
MKPDHESEGQRWLRQAERDLSDARFALEGGRYSLGCFLGQQAGEKALKGYLYHMGAEDVWGNSLADLCEDAKVFDLTFDALKSLAVLLDKYYLLTRYPAALPGGIPADVFDAIEAQRAIELAQEVISFVQARMSGQPS